MAKTLIFVPTFNERALVTRMCEQIHALQIDADLLFTDDNSPDGTGEVLDSLASIYPRLLVHHRPGKLGIGSAHGQAIEFAYSQGYDTLVTLDCDFTHSPADIPKLVGLLSSYDVAVGSRWLTRKSLPGWNLFRRVMTHGGHLLTSRVLGVPQDATGAFRAYRLDRIPRSVFKLVRSNGYSFFFESLFLLNRNGCTIGELPIVLPARTYGHSKMSLAAALRSLRYVFELRLTSALRPMQVMVDPKAPDFDGSLIDPQGWDEYWKVHEDRTGRAYQFVAGAYRRLVIKRNLERVLRGVFPAGSELLHAGCGGGDVDVALQRELRLTAVDISSAALRLYSQNNPCAVNVRHGDILELPFPDASFDGVYNLGVVEHFTEDEIARLLTEFRRVLRPGGKVVIFWPHERATSVFVLRCVHWLLRVLGMNRQPLHPPEVTYMRGTDHARAALEGAGFSLVGYDFDARDLYVQAVVIGARQ